MKRILCVLMATLLVALTLPSVGRADESCYASTPLYGSSDNKQTNVELAVQAIDGWTLEYGDTFSFNDIVGDRTRARGYKPALNGRGVSVVGGGVAQVATTIYLALLQMDDIEYNELHTYGDRFADDYVDDGYYAVTTDYDSDIDFSFTTLYDGTIQIWLWSDGDEVSCMLSLSGGGGGSENMIGYAETPLYYASNGNLTNIELCADSVIGTTLEHGDTFSFNDIVGPRETRYGYVKGVNGRGATVVGGGVAQVASTVYLAVHELDCVSVTEKRTYSNFTGDYVDDNDAAIVTDYKAGTDFAFRYTGYGELTVYTYVSNDYLICEIYEN